MGLTGLAGKEVHAETSAVAAGVSGVSRGAGTMPIQHRNVNTSTTIVNHDIFEEVASANSQNVVVSCGIESALFTLVDTSTRNARGGANKQAVNNEARGDSTRALRGTRQA